MFFTRYFQSYIDEEEKSWENRLYIYHYDSFKSFKIFKLLVYIFVKCYRKCYYKDQKRDIG